MKVVVLIIMGLSLLYADFSKNGDIVRDSTRMLEWQDSKGSVALNWKEAITKCENLVLGGESDWRLPNISELKSIVNRSYINPSSIDNFSNVSSSSYWSSTTYNNDTKDNAWIIDFSYGYVNYDVKKSSNGVLCVRDTE